MPPPRRMTPRLDDTAADTATLVDLGRADAPPVPSPDPPQRPDRGGPRPDRDRVERAERLADALVDAGVQVNADDAAAVDALSGLDPATVATITEWVRGGKGGQSPGGRT